MTLKKYHMKNFWIYSGDKLIQLMLLDNLQIVAPNIGQLFFIIMKNKNFWQKNQKNN